MLEATLLEVFIFFGASALLGLVAGYAGGRTHQGQFNNSQLDDIETKAKRIMDHKYDEIMQMVLLEEGKVVKGGVNKPPTVPRPPEPKGQVSADKFINNIKVKMVDKMIEKEMDGQKPPIIDTFGSPPVYYGPWSQHD